MDINNHPIPQDITGFQFKLVGSMTLKQFGYLAGGFIFAWLFYVSPLFFIIKIALAVSCAATGASLAFLPVDGRPLDLMLINLFKAITKPTRYIYQQSIQDLPQEDAKKLKDFNKKRQSIADMSEQQLQAFLKTLPKATSKVDQKEMVFFKNISDYQKNELPLNLPGYVPQHAFSNQAPESTTAQVLQAAPTTLPGAKTNQPKINPTAEDTFKKNPDILNIPLVKPAGQTVQNPAPVATPTQDTKQFLETHQKVLELQQNLGDLQLQKQQLEERLIQMQKQISAQNQNAVTPQIAQQQPEEAKLVRSIPQSMVKRVGLINAPEFPNVISGIVKDPRENPLPNMLVEVKDSQGNAVRAFKTNALGQFASATALPNGDFTIEFEDPRGQNKFETVGFKANGEIIMPLEVISVDTREELRRSLFN